LQESLLPAATVLDDRTLICPANLIIAIGSGSLGEGNLFIIITGGGDKAILPSTSPEPLVNIPTNSGDGIYTSRVPMCPLGTVSSSQGTLLLHLVVSGHEDIKSDDFLPSGIILLNLGY
jgi:hypothetical protein